jgi:hypothetical protein
MLKWNRWEVVKDFFYEKFYDWWALCCSASVGQAFFLDKAGKASNTCSLRRIFGVAAVVLERRKGLAS